MPKNQESCADCRYWKPLASLCKVGLCRRYPPTIIIVPESTYAVEEELTRWPDVGFDDWCGEWKSKHTKK